MADRPKKLWGIWVIFGSPISTNFVTVHLQSMIQDQSVFFYKLFSHFKGMYIQALVVNIGCKEFVIQTSCDCSPWYAWSSLVEQHFNYGETGSGWRAFLLLLVCSLYSLLTALKLYIPSTIKTQINLVHFFVFSQIGPSWQYCKFSNSLGVCSSTICTKFNVQIRAGQHVSHPC